MKLRFIPPDLRRLDEVGTEVLACGLFADDRPPHGTAGSRRLAPVGPARGRQIQRGFVTGALGEVVMVPVRPKLPFDKALLFGLGPRKDFGEALFRSVLRAMLAAMEGFSRARRWSSCPGVTRRPSKPS